MRKLLRWTAVYVPTLAINLFLNHTLTTNSDQEYILKLCILVLISVFIFTMFHDWIYD